MAKSKSKAKKPVPEPDPEVQSNEEEFDELDGEGSEGEEMEEDAEEEAEAQAAPGHDPQEVLDPEKHVAIHLGGDAHKIMLLSEFPGVRPYSRTLNYQGKTVEHTHDHRGVWAYRHLG